MNTEQDDSDDIVIIPPPTDDDPAPADPVVEPVLDTVVTDDDDGSVITTTANEDEENDENTLTGDITYDVDKIDFRGEPRAYLVDLIQSMENEIGAPALDTQTRTVGSWANTVFRAIMEPNFEEQRIQEAIAQVRKTDNGPMTNRYRNEAGKTLLRTSSISQPLAAGEVKSFSGDAALMAFECQDMGGGFRVPLYNTGITVDVIVPTGNDLQTMLSNCMAFDRELGSSSGAHYFAYHDLLYKQQLMAFLQPLIINSSYADWRKRGKLWSIFKLPDLVGLVATLAALCYKDGFEDFVTKCTRPISEEHPKICGHTESLTVDIFNMVATRFPVLSKESIEFMVEARSGTKHTVTQIAKYQAGLGLEGEVITFDDISFTMRIPSMAEHIDAGKGFIADIQNEIEGDNTDGLYEQFGFRYIRNFVPWVASVTRTGKNGGASKTAEPKVIIRALELLDVKDEENKVRDRLREYVNKVQLTYVGYPVTACPTCGYMADTPSGMWTFDPFTSFFTLAFLCLNQNA